MKKRHFLPLTVAAASLLAIAGCKPRADGFTKLQHPAISNNVEANEIDWNDGEPFGLPKNVFRNVASLTEMSQDQVCFEVVLSGFDDEAAADLARAGFILYVGDERFTPKVEQLVEPSMSTHRGKKTEWETVDTGLREQVCVDGVKNDRGEYVSCTRWQQNAITETRSYDVPMDYNVVTGAGQACFETKGKVKPADVEHLLLEITNAKSERTSAFWGVRYQATTRLRWDLIGDVPETVGATWGGVGGSQLVKTALKNAAPKEEPEEKVAEKEKPAEEEASEEIAKIGIAACDDYVAKMLQCADKMPAASRKPMRDGAKQSAESFKKMAGMKATRASAEQACKQAAASLKQNSTCK